MAMKYIRWRLAYAALLLTAISFLSFALLQLAPGDYFDALRMNPQISAQPIAGIRSEYGLDRPLAVRYGHWLMSVLKGEFGYSIAYNSSVGALLWVRARSTLLLAVTATGLAWLLAIPVGAWSAKNRGTWSDRACGVATSALLTIPDLLLFLILLFIAVRTGWFPAGGMISAGTGHQ